MLVSIQCFVCVRTFAHTSSRCSCAHVAMHFKILWIDNQPKAANQRVVIANISSFATRCTLNSKEEQQKQKKTCTSTRTQTSQRHARLIRARSSLQNMARIVACIIAIIHYLYTSIFFFLYIFFLNWTEGKNSEWQKGNYKLPSNSTV